MIHGLSSLNPVSLLSVALSYQSCEKMIYDINYVF